MKWTLEHSHLILLSRELCFKRVQLPPPAYFGIQILCASVTCSIESVIFCSIFTSCGTFHKKNQSNSTAGVNKLKEDVHYQLQTFLLFEVFSISLSLHQHQWSHSWEAIKVTQLEMINERSVATTALNIGFFRPFFSFSLQGHVCLFVQVHYWQSHSTTQQIHLNMMEGMCLIIPSH